MQQILFLTKKKYWNLFRNNRIKNKWIGNGKFLNIFYLNLIFKNILFKVSLGLADYYIKSEKIPELLKELKDYLETKEFKDIKNEEVK